MLAMVSIWGCQVFTCLSITKRSMRLRAAFPCGNMVSHMLVCADQTQGVWLGPDKVANINLRRLQEKFMSSQDEFNCALWVQAGSTAWSLWSCTGVLQLKQP